MQNGWWATSIRPPWHVEADLPPPPRSANSFCRSTGKSRSSTTARRPPARRRSPRRAARAADWSRANSAATRSVVIPGSIVVEEGVVARPLVPDGVRPLARQREDAVEPGCERCESSFPRAATHDCCAIAVARAHSSTSRRGIGAPGRRRAGSRARSPLPGCARRSRARSLRPRSSTPRNAGRSRGRAPSRRAARADRPGAPPRRAACRLPRPTPAPRGRRRVATPRARAGSFLRRRLRGSCGGKMR